MWRQTSRFVATVRPPIGSRPGVLAINLLLIDANSLDRAAIRRHMESLFALPYTLIDVTSHQELLHAMEDETFTADAVILGTIPEQLTFPELITNLGATYPMATMVLVTGKSRYNPGPMTGVDPARLNILPDYELARLPLILNQRQWNLTQMARTLDPFSSLPEVDADIFRTISSLTADYVYIGAVQNDGSTTVHYRSDALIALTGYTQEEIDAGGTEMFIHADDLPILEARRASMRHGNTRSDEFRIITKSGQILWIRDHIRAIPSMDEHNQWTVIGAAQDITNEKLLNSRLSVQASILEMIAHGRERTSVLKSLNDVVEEQIPGTMCSVQLADHERGILHPEIHASLPESFLTEIAEIPIGPEHGACGNAAFHKELTIVPDVSSDARFDLYQDLVREYEIRSVWSTPIFDSSDNVAGTFALYFRTPRTPIDHEIALVQSAAQIAGIALDVAGREQERQIAQSRYQTLVEQTPAITFMSDPSDPFSLTYLSPQFDLFSEVPAEYVLQNRERVLEFIHPDDHEMVKSAVQQSAENGTPLRIEFRIRRRSGVISWLQASVFLVRDNAGTPIHWLGVMLDVTDRYEAIRQMRESDRRYRSLFDENLTLIVIFDYEGFVVDMNPAAERASGYERDELVGQALMSMIIPEDRERVERYFLQTRAGISCQYTMTIINKAGEPIELSVSQSPVIVDGEIIGVLSICEDVTERRRLESQLLHQAYHDALTGLPNRVYFDQILTNAMETLHRDSVLAVMFLDLNNFKVINDSLGHDVGDKYLTEIARQLSAVVPKDAVVARFGGDEFTVLLPEHPEALQRTVDLSRQIMQTLHGQVTIDGYDLASNVCVGIASTTRDERCSPKELIRRADIALYDAKQDGRESNYRIFHENMDAWVFERLWIERDLRQALENQEFVIHYQPMVDIDLGVVGVLEALVRWNHPERGLLLPERFLPIAEETGHIMDIDLWVLESACQKVAEWNRANPEQEPIFAGVNLSARSFWRAGLVEQIIDVLDKAGLDPRLLCLEITESTLMRDTDQATRVVQELRAHGVLIAVDDFGTGYSSLSYLRTFPIDVLKIDRTFIHGLEDNEQQVQLVQAIVSMGKALDLEVVAEGIETERQFQLARDLGCKLAQGYHIAVPGPFEEVTPVVESLFQLPRVL